MRCHVAQQPVGTRAASAQADCGVGAPIHVLALHTLHTPLTLFCFLTRINLWNTFLPACYASLLVNFGMRLGLALCIVAHCYAPHGVCLIGISLHRTPCHLLFPASHPSSPLLHAVQQAVLDGIRFNLPLCKHEAAGARMESGRRVSG